LCPLFTGGLGSVNGPALRLRSGRSSLEMVHWTISLAFGQPLLTQQNCRQAILGVSEASDPSEAKDEKHAKACADARLAFVSECNELTKAGAVPSRNSGEDWSHPVRQFSFRHRVVRFPARRFASGVRLLVELFFLRHEMQSWT